MFCCSCLYNSTFSSMPVYSLFRPAVSKYRRNSYRADFVSDLLQFDCASFVHQPDRDDNQTLCKQCFVAVDSFSRFCFVAPIPLNKTKYLIECLTAIRNTGLEFESVLSDGAGENMSAEMKRYLKSENVRQLVTKSDKHTPQVSAYIFLFVIWFTFCMFI